MSAAGVPFITSVTNTPLRGGMSSSRASSALTGWMPMPRYARRTLPVSSN